MIDRLSPETYRRADDHFQSTGGQPFVAGPPELLMLGPPHPVDGLAQMLAGCPG
ncbi:MAG: hypothetical protein SH850_09510 [Planctomycetaceae bacterium]|nr:hypothetical protein [Planctomycetaceae bacterium]